MERITRKMLNGKVDLLNKLLGQPTESYSKKENGEWAPNPRVFYIGGAYGGYRLERMCNSGSGASDISPRGTKREVYDYVKAFIQGVEEVS